MNNKKLWHSFAVILTYLIFTAFVATGVNTLFQNFHVHWGFPFGIGVAFWIASLILWFQHEKHAIFIILALLTNAIGAGFAIAAFAVGKAIELSFFALPVLATMIAALYLILILLLTIPNLKDMIWYLIVCYVVWMAGSVLLGIFIFPHIFEVLHFSVPTEFGIFLTFFFLLLGFLAVGTIIPVDDFFGLLHMLIVPALIATFLIFVIVLAVLTECDSCDCGGECCDGCGCGNDRYRSSTPTQYMGKPRVHKTMSSMSNP